VATVVPRRLERRSETSHPEPGGEIDRSRDGYEISHGFTLVEVLIVVALILTIAAIALPYLSSTLDEARYAKAVADIHTLQDAINADQLQNGVFTDSLATIGFGYLVDPWGNPYQYLNHATMHGNGQARKDRFLVPLNTDYDLYSMGKDGQTASPLTAQVSQDDIIRANDGSYVGLASLY